MYKINQKRNLTDFALISGHKNSWAPGTPASNCAFGGLCGWAYIGGGGKGGLCLG